MSWWIRPRRDADITDAHEVLLDLLSAVRDEAREQYGTSERSGWELVIDEELVELVALGRIDQAEDRLRAAVALTRHDTFREEETHSGR